MKTIAVWSFILIPLTAFAVYLGSTLTPETAALTMGAILGLGLAAVAILFGFLLRDERHRRQREQARRPHPAPAYIDATWRDVHPSPQPPTPASNVTASRSPSPVTASRSASPVIASRSSSPVIASRSGEAISPPAPTRALTRRS